MGDDPALKEGLVGLAGMCCFALQRLLGLLMVLGYTHQYLNKPSKKLDYYSEAVYPFYIVHQTIVVSGSLLTQFSLGPILEPILLFVNQFSRLNTQTFAYRVKCITFHSW
jgi:hypothetical protein